MGASLKQTRTQASVNIYPVIPEMRDVVIGDFSPLKCLLEDYFPRYRVTNEVQQTTGRPKTITR